MRTLTRQRMQRIATLGLLSGLAIATAGAVRAEGGPAWAPGAVLEQTGWQVGSVAYSRDGRRLVAGGTGGHVRMYDVGTWKVAWETQDGDHPAAVAISPDGTAVAVTTTDGARLLDAATGTTVDVLDEKGSRPTAVAVFPEAPAAGGGRGRKVIFGNAGGYVVKMWLTRASMSTATLNTALPGRPPADPDAAPLAVDPEGRRVVITGPIDPATGKNVLLAWSAGSGAGNQLLEGHAATVTAAAWSANGNTVATGDAGGTVIVRDGATFRELSRRTLPGRVAGLAVAHDGGRVAVVVIGPGANAEAGGHTEDVHIWAAGAPPESSTLVGRQAADGPFAGVAGVAFAPDGKAVATGFLNREQPRRPGSVRIWTLGETR